MADIKTFLNQHLTKLLFGFTLFSFLLLCLSNGGTWMTDDSEYSRTDDSLWRRCYTSKENLFQKTICRWRDITNNSHALARVTATIFILSAIASMLLSLLLLAFNIRSDKLITFLFSQAFSMSLALVVYDFNKEDVSWGFGMGWSGVAFSFITAILSLVVFHKENMKTEVLSPNIYMTKS